MMDLSKKDRETEVDGTGSKSWQMANSGIIDVSF
jgi:hypothetical protein